MVEARYVHGCWVTGAARVCEDGTKGCAREHPKTSAPEPRPNEALPDVIVRRRVSWKCSSATCEWKEDEYEERWPSDPCPFCGSPTVQITPRPNEARPGHVDTHPGSCSYALCVADIIRHKIESGHPASTVDLQQWWNLLLGYHELRPGAPVPPHRPEPAVPDLLAKAIGYLNRWHEHPGVPVHAWREHDAEVQALVEMMRPTSAPCRESPEPTPSEPRELHCERCDRDYPMWVAPNELWNLVVRDPCDAAGLPEPFLCLTCFALRAEEIGIRPTAWVVRPERPEDMPGESPKPATSGEHRPIGEHRPAEGDPR